MKFVPLLLAAWLCIPTLSQASPNQTDVSSDVALLSERWAEITYTQPADQHATLLKALYAQTNQALQENASNPDLLSWAGIITASYAGSKGGLGALKLAKKARSHLEAAIAIDPEALNGGARTSLGALYYQVPPWPVGFGNSNKAEKLLVKSYQSHPGNIDVLFFYGDFLQKQKRNPEAIKVLKEAAALPLREHRLVADTGRKKMIRQMLLRLNNKSS